MPDFSWYKKQFIKLLGNFDLDVGNSSLFLATVRCLIIVMCNYKMAPLTYTKYKSSALRLA